MANWQRGVLRLMGVRNHPVEVVSVEDFTPWYRRIVFSSPEFVRALEVVPTLWLRLWVPNPARGEGGVSQRGYTFVDVRPAEGTFALEFVLHDTAGPAGDWARRAEPGERPEAALTPAKISVPAGTTTLLLAGDATALPAITGWLAQVPDELTVRVYLEDGHEDHHALPLGSRAGTEFTWVPPEGGPGAALAAAVIAAESPGPGRYAWAAGERSLVKALRPVLREHLGLDRAHRFTQSYWIAGRAAG
ncbi:siderophore-interacting protein [Amycolatopsis sp. PS_44_ISF1]|uniref:siderophore-interacting protein n=1 Tax=Amycolatopsis sp. PS_44_ISF1 TaxID=2974917 RepID=UPI0028E07430|nr:siderophore-interacting protein [Amycolatopsis sp. PS_44_ISF1]MDT8913372.1 siderophore-interacting protein [Amycolatopsis sp. PS_44_ISF1]